MSISTKIWDDEIGGRKTKLSNRKPSVVAEHL